MTGDRCPECGTLIAEFGGIRAEYEGGTRPFVVAIAFASSAPLAWSILVHAMRVVARMVLGRWPSGGMDDPKGIPVVCEIHTVLVVLMMMFAAMMLALPVLLACLAARVIQKKATWGTLFRVLIWSSAAAAIGIAVIRVDPVGAVEWFRD